MPDTSPCVWGGIGWALTLVFWLSACTMPLPLSESSGKTTFVPDNQSALPDPLGFQSSLIPLRDIGTRTGLYNGTGLTYLELNACGTDSRCSNELPVPLSLLSAYQFVYADNTPVKGQLPVFSLPELGQKPTPFRQIFRVVVPTTYVPNTLRSAEDIAASQFRVEETPLVHNYPLVSVDAATQLRIQDAWQKNVLVKFLDLGTVPYSATNRQLGVSLVYFLRNRDRTDLPSLPAPIFDTVPGDLLYSPIRQVFRAVSENQIVSEAGDISRSIRSQRDLLQAVNQGLFRLENTGRFFNYPVLTDALLQPQSPTEIYALYLRALQGLPLLPESAHYALWALNQSRESRLLLRFKAAGGTLLDLQGQPQSLNEPVFRFSSQEIQDLTQLQVTIESRTEASPSATLFLSAGIGPKPGRQQLQAPFQEAYARLQEGSFLLATPSDSRTDNGTEGLWFVRSGLQQSKRQPLSTELEPGLVLGGPPPGWTYQGWVLYRRYPEIWLSTGRFQAVNQSDQSAAFSGSLQGYPFPGEDFLLHAPKQVVFPFNLASMGETEVVVSLEPVQMASRSPFLPLFRASVPKGTPAYLSRTLPPVTPIVVRMETELRRELLLNQN